MRGSRREKESRPTESRAPVLTKEFLELNEQTPSCRFRKQVRPVNLHHFCWYGVLVLYVLVPPRFLSQLLDRTSTDAQRTVTNNNSMGASRSCARGACDARTVGEVYRADGWLQQCRIGCHVVFTQAH